MAQNESHAGHGEKKEAPKQLTRLEKTEIIISIIASIVTIVATILTMIFSIK